MPCVDERRFDSSFYIDNQEYKQKIREISKRNEWLEAALCAIITELEKRNIANKIISESSRNGLIGLMDFWKEHSKDDNARLAYELHKFSKHEQEVLKNLLNNSIKRRI
jgi:hypothetical protein